MTVRVTEERFKLPMTASTFSGGGDMNANVAEASAGSNPPLGGSDRLAFRTALLNSSLMDAENTGRGPDASRPGGMQSRWRIHLSLLTLYPLSVGLLAALGSSNREGPMLRPDVPVLCSAVLAEMGVFGFFFVLAWLASRVTAEQLFLRSWNGVRALWRGLVWSVGLRLVVSAVVGGLAVIGLIVGDSNQEFLRELRPQHEELVDAQALTTNPAYLVLNLTVVSFLLAGFREELWRAGMLAGFAVLFPQSFATMRGKAIAIGLTAVVFGLGHLMQGWGGVAMTTVLGVGLGVIMLRYRSLWDPALAHGCFNATTFAMLYFLAKYRPEILL
jgi:membrane protease YdiL (CAAX protease family)